MYVASQVVTALQAIASREVDARKSLVVSVGTLNAGSRYNIIAAKAVLTGTVRTLEEACESPMLTNTNGEPLQHAEGDRVVDCYFWYPYGQPGSGATTSTRRR